MSTVIVSTHFDDGLLSLGGSLLSGLIDPSHTTVLTVCGGTAPAGAGPSDWDELSGFVSAQESTESRRAEDAAACAIVGVAPQYLDHLDGPYMEDGPYGVRRWDRAAVTADIRAAVAAASTVYLPAGIGGHVDHLLVRDCTLDAVAGAPAGTEIRMYADLPYAGWSSSWSGKVERLDPGTERCLVPVAALTPRLRFSDWRGTVLDEPHWLGKRAAVLCHRSQLAPLGAVFDYFLAADGPLRRELTWRLDPRTDP